MKIKLFLLTIFFFTVSSCKKYDDFPSVGAASNDPITNFEAFWIGINDNYAFFAYDDLNWDDVYNEFRPQVSTSTSDDELRIIFRQMLTKLIDGHSLIRIDGKNYGKLRNKYVNRYNPFDTDDIILSKYLESDTASNFYYYDVYSYEESNSVFPEFYIARIKNSNIFYIRYFTYQKALEDQAQDLRFNSFLSQVQNSRFVDGLILDIRNNGGGLASSFKNLISKFIKGKSETWGYSKFRVSRDRYETTPFLSETVNFSGDKEFTLPLVILNNRYSFSAAELTSLAMKNQSNVTLVGDTTGGAEGPIYTAESEGNGLDKDFTGNFKLPNGWIVQLAQKASFDSQKNIYEGKGIPPDVLVIPSVIDASNNKDNVLEAAVKFLDPNIQF